MRAAVYSCTSMCRFDAEILAAISGDTILLASGYLLILLYVILNLGRYNRLEHKVRGSTRRYFVTLKRIILQSSMITEFHFTNGQRLAPVKLFQMLSFTFAPPPLFCRFGCQQLAYLAPV